MKPEYFYWRTLLAVVAMAALFAFVFGRHQKSQGDTQSASSFNPAPAGNKALYVTLQEMGWPAERWQNGLGDLSGRNQVLILTRNGLGRWYDLTKTDIDHLVAWVEGGNELILLGDFASRSDTRALLERLHFVLPRALTAGERLYEESKEALAPEREVMTLHPATFGIGNAAATSLHSNQIAKASSLPAPTTLIVQKGSALPTPPPGMAILWQDQHFPHVIRIPLGAGSIIWGSSASVIDNDFLRRADNLPWFLSLLRNGDKMPERIWFEEAHHGYRKNYALADLLKDPGLRLAAIQAAMGLLLFLTSQLTRFGSTIPLESDSGRSGMEFVEWMAQLYRNADLRNEIVQTLFEETRARIQHKFNLPPRASDEILDQRLRDAFPQLPSWKKISRQFQLFYAAELRLPPAGWLKISRDLIHIKREMI